MFPAIHVDSPSSGSLVERSPDLDLHRKPLAKWSCRVVGAVGIEPNATVLQFYCRGHQGIRLAERLRASSE